ncbi:hypothetical protein GH714_033931 [Hevea brasiliensis]|uniref:Uncharacterized protein n=1 Tax=Hevea brasiliensis TaxID=3981 RepID=A0A6A6KK06_HEVBR|nr:hypothetical protein GH714_033931 [Hevea brasiliensis]
MLNSISIGPNAGLEEVPDYTHSIWQDSCDPSEAGLIGKDKTIAKMAELHYIVASDSESAREEKSAYAFLEITIGIDIAYYSVVSESGMAPR